jgi:hypothetical protein
MGGLRPPRGRDQISRVLGLALSGKYGFRSAAVAVGERKLAGSIAES